MIKKLFLNDKVILILILINAGIIFVNGFEISANINATLSWTDNCQATIKNNGNDNYFYC